MTIGEIAARCNLNASAIRYYEQSGLLPRAPRVGGRRIYGEDVIDRLTFIQFARDAGFTIEEVKVLCAGGALSAKMRRLATTKIEEVDRLVARAAMMKEMLARALRCQCLDTVECGRRIRARRSLGP